MPLNTDLALEAYKQLKEGESLEGVSSKEYFDSEAMLKITDIEILTEEAAKHIGKPTGRYITLESEQPFYEFSDKTAQRINALTDAVEKVCGGNMGVFAAALCDSGLSRAEIEELRSLLEKGGL